MESPPAPLAGQVPRARTGVSRRAALRLFAGTGAAVALTGCGEDGIDLPFDLVSDQTVAELGLQSWQQIQAKVPVSRNAERQEAVRRIADRLLRTAGHDPRRWEVQVFASPEVNAFALPGNRIGVFEGLFRVAATPGQMAAVIGHEIGHIQAEHGKSRVEAELLKSYGLTIVNFALNLGDVPFSREIGALLGLGAEFGISRPYGRRQETQADRLGVLLMARAGYKPEEAIALWERMGQMSRADMPAFLGTHPAPGDRIEAIRALLPEARAALPG